MIAKLITYSPTRDLAIRAMSKALGKYRVVGLPTNLKFLKNVFDNEIFRKGDYDTSFIEKNIDDLVPLTKKVDFFDIVSALAVKSAIGSSGLRIPKELVNFRNGVSNTITHKIRTSATYF